MTISMTHQNPVAGCPVAPAHHPELLPRRALHSGAHPAVVCPGQRGHVSPRVLTRVVCPAPVITPVQVPVHPPAHHHGLGLCAPPDVRSV